LPSGFIKFSGPLNPIYAARLKRLDIECPIDFVASSALSAIVEQDNSYRLSSRLVSRVLPISEERVEKNYTFSQLPYTVFWFRNGMLLEENA
ncbi:unnamed protein product, partial [Protopolystoma xenopodis]